MSITSATVVQSTISALTVWFEHSWLRYQESEDSTKLKMGYVESVDALRSFRRVEGEIQYPYMAAALVTIALDTERGGYNKHFLHQGITRNTRDNTGTIRKLRPVKVGLGVKFKTDTLSDVMRLTNIIMDNQPGPVLVLQDAEGFLYECRVFFDPEVSIPSVTSAEDGKHFDIEMVISFNSWMGSLKKVPLITKVQVDFNEGSSSHRTPVILDIANKTTELMDTFTRDYSDVFNPKSNYYREE